MNSQRELNESGFRNELNIFQQVRDKECSSCSKYSDLSDTLPYTCKIKENLLIVQFARSAVEFIAMSRGSSSVRIEILRVELDHLPDTKHSEPSIYGSSVRIPDFREGHDHAVTRWTIEDHQGWGLV